jgi:hypothetical protein
VEWFFKIAVAARELQETMKVLTLALLCTLPVAHLAPQKPLREPTSQISKRSKGGRWYFAATGHAVYCYGPVMTVPAANGDLQRVATFCRDGSAIVPLKD